MPPHTALSGDLFEEPLLERGSQHIKVNPKISPRCNFLSIYISQRHQIYMSDEYQNGHYFMVKDKGPGTTGKLSFTPF